MRSPMMFYLFKVGHSRSFTIIKLCLKAAAIRLTMNYLTHFILETPKGVLAKSADPDQMPHNVASDLGLHYFASCSTIFQQKYLN